MESNGFTAEDFNVFKIPGLEPRMDALKTRIRPKLEQLSDVFKPILTDLTGEEMFVHVAKHARRTVHPPNDTWVSFSSNPRGYKMMPHFQIGLWETHLFVWFALIYETKNKEEIGTRLVQKAQDVYHSIPSDYVWSTDHMKPDSIPHDQLSMAELQDMFAKLQKVKKAELLCGIRITRDEAIQLTGEQLIERIQPVFVHLLPLYNSI